MGALLGLLFGTGVVLVWSSLRPRAARARAPARRPGWRERTAESLAQAGIESVSPGALVASSLGVGAVTALVMLGLSRSAPIAAAFALIATLGPRALVRMRQRQRQAELRELWPEVVDNIASAVRAGLSLPEALGQLGTRGPEPLRRPFQRFGEDYRATGRFAESLDRLKASLADPVADRIVESLRTAREVGGTDLGRLLRTLSAFLREDARTRAELETRQGWTVNAARLAVAAPWVLLGLLSTRPEAVRAYNSGAGVVVLASGGAVCLVAYRTMIRIGRLPREERVLR
jgi:tight adherence protein B